MPTSQCPDNSFRRAETLSPGLYVVATHIGNPGDITLRAIQVLTHCDAVVCEERRQGIRLLKSLGLEKPLYLLNEHTKTEEIKLIFDELLILKDKAVVMISDAGTPGFADPGAELVSLCHEYQISVNPVPGASSLMAALMSCGMRIERFLYYGFLSAKKEERQSELKQIKTQTKYDIIFLEAPYRLKNVIEDMKSILGKHRKARLFYKLTQAGQKIIPGTLEEISTMANELPKGEFILILEHDSRF